MASIIFAKVRLVCDPGQIRLPEPQGSRKQKKTPYTFLCKESESERRDLNPRHPPWQGGALPLSYFRKKQPINPISNQSDWKVRCERGDLNPYTVRYQILSLACLPISPLSRCMSCPVKDPPCFEPQRDRTFDPQIKSLLLYQLS